MGGWKGSIGLLAIFAVTITLTAAFTYRVTVNQFTLLNCSPVPIDRSIYDLPERQESEESRRRLEALMGAGE